MTQPIQEPSTDRALQGFAYARDQIFRRPAPVSGQSDETPYGYIAWLEGANVASGSFWNPAVNIPEDWTEAYINPAAQVVNAGAGDSLIEPSLSAGNLTINQGLDGPFGLWHLHAGVGWADSGPVAGDWLAIRIAPVGSGTPLASPTSEMWQPADMVFNESANQAHTHSLDQILTDDVGVFTMSVFQNSGSPLFLNYMYLLIWREEIFDGDTGSFFP